MPPMTSGAGGISSASTWSSDKSCERRASLIVAAGLLAAVRVARSVVVVLERGAARADPRVVLERYCIGCHDSAERAGGLALDRLAAR